MTSLMMFLSLALTSLVVLAATYQTYEASSRSLRTQVTIWPSLSLHFTIKRRAMQVYGESEFTMFARPQVSEDSKVFYDAVATFTHSSTVYNYTLFDGASYITRNGLDGNDSTVCLDSDVLPPINSIVAAINSAIAVSDGSTTKCSTKNAFKVSVGGTEFALCAAGSSGFTMLGNDMDIAVAYLPNQVDILQPKVSGNDCKTVAFSSSITATGKTILTGEELSQNTRRLKAEFSFKSLLHWGSSGSGSDSNSDERAHSHSGSDASGNSDSHGQCSCQSTPRPCVFIHGMGIDSELPVDQDDFPYYWGNLTDHAPCCTTMKYAHLDTVNNSWYDTTQQQKVCDRALEVSETSTDTVIADTIIITHSMGGLMVGGAIANGLCSLATTSTWVSLGSPMGGSMGSDFTQDACDGDSSLLLEKIGDITGRCPATMATKSLAYENGNYSTTAMNAAYQAAQRVYRTSISGAICSKGYSGLVSSYQWQFWLMGSQIPHHSGQNDGMVEFDSCRAGIPKEKFGKHYASAFYASHLNHYDLEFLSGDSLLDTEKMPVKWFECLL